MILLIVIIHMFKTANRRGTCVPATIIACLGPGTLVAELVGPGTAFRPTLTPGRIGSLHSCDAWWWSHA